jgi:hypothetical protein
MSEETRKCHCGGIITKRAISDKIAEITCSNCGGRWAAETYPTRFDDPTPWNETGWHRTGNALARLAVALLKDRDEVRVSTDELDSAHEKVLRGYTEGGEVVIFAEPRDRICPSCVKFEHQRCLRKTMPLRHCECVPCAAERS